MKNSLHENISLTEMPRVSGDPEINYDEKKVKRRATGVEEIEKIFVVLSGKASEIATKCAKKYKQIDRITALLKKRRDELNKTMKGQFEELFDAADEVHTRVIETKSMTITHSKQTTGTKTSVDFDAFLEDTYKLLPEYEKQLKALLQKHTTVKPTKSDAKVMAPRFKESMDDLRTLAGIKKPEVVQEEEDDQGVSKLANAVKSSMKKVDVYLDKVKRKYGLA